MLIGLATILLVTNLHWASDNFLDVPDNHWAYELIGEFKKDDIIPDIESVSIGMERAAFSRTLVVEYATMMVEGIPKHCGHVDEWLTTPETMDVASLKELKRKYGTGLIARIDKFIDIFAPEIMARHLRPNDLKRDAHNYREPADVDRAVDKELAARRSKVEEVHRTRERAR